MLPKEKRTCQVRCPQTGRHEVVELRAGESGEPDVVWCSRDLDNPDCSRACLEELKTVSFIMLCDVPTFQRSELERLTQDAALGRFESVPLDRLPVLEGDRLVGSLALRDVAFWKDCRELKNRLPMAEWNESEPGNALEECVKREEVLLSMEDSWKKATQLLLSLHLNEAFVVDSDGCFAGVVYARQLLRLAVG